MSTLNTELPVSRTLSRLGLSPKTACADCPNGVWFSTTGAPTSPNVFCRLFHSVIEWDLAECDGKPAPAPIEMPDTTLEEIQGSQDLMSMLSADLMGAPDPEPLPATPAKPAGKYDHLTPDDSDSMPG